MRFYEEFGIPGNASAEQIKESYHTLVRLLHPDQHGDPALKGAAERQMRRINQIYAVLSDPERRRRYDAEWKEPERFPVIVAVPPPPVRRMRLTGFLWGGVALAICGFIWWLADRDSGYSSHEFAMTSDAVEQPADKGAAHPAAEVKKRPEAPRPAAPEASRKLESFGPWDLPHRHAPAEPEAAAAIKVAGPGEAPTASRTVEPEAVVATKVTEPEPAAAPEPRPEPEPAAHFAGAWFYPRSRTVNKNPALYPPEYIETMITEEHGSVHGRYRARYLVADRAISPDVVFQFDGRLSAPVANLTWTGAGGAHGLIHLKLISDSTMEVDWSASDRGREMGLVSGTAVLKRRAD